MSQNRGSWGSNLGFLMAAVGSAVGLGNIWGFPYKMGAGGGFTFLIIYLGLAVFVGYIIMVSELAIGRRAGKSVMGSYAELAEGKGVLVKIASSFIGFLAMFSPFLIMSFYSVLGAYCIRYMVVNITNIFAPTSLTGGELFEEMLLNQPMSVFYTLVFMLICLFIVRGGIKGGIERFNTIAMPSLAVMLLITIARSVTLPGAGEGLKFMFIPNYAVSAGFIEKAPSFLTVLASAGGQMFFSLSLAMGVMVTYGSYLPKKENLSKNGIIVVISDTVIALMAGFAVIPAAVASGISRGIPFGDIKLSGPSLLYITLQDVFDSMGAVGPFFGVIFYLLVILAAVTSAISLMEVQVTFFMDRAAAKGKTGNRSMITLAVFLAIMAEALVVALDGLGSNGLPQPLGFVWLDFMDLWSEGIAMPLGALLMSLLVGWVIGPEMVRKEVTLQGNRFGGYGFYKIALRFIAPLGMLLILLGQLDGFFAFGWF